MTTPTKRETLVWYHEGSNRIRISYSNPCGCCPDSMDLEEVPFGKVRPKRVSLIGMVRAYWRYRAWESFGWVKLGEL